MATGDADVPKDVPKLVGEDGGKLMTQLANSEYELKRVSH